MLSIILIIVHKGMFLLHQIALEEFQTQSYQNLTLIKSRCFFPIYTTQLSSFFSTIGVYKKMLFY